jgi:hypothetical protein
MVALLLGETPALPLHTAGKYVAGAYIVLFVLVLIYVAIMAVRLSRIERSLGELLELSEHPAAERSGAQAGAPRDTEPDPVEMESTPA